MTDFDYGPMMGMIGLGITAGIAVGTMRMMSDAFRGGQEREHYHTKHITHRKSQSGYYFDPYGGRY
jgi:hypothetical protein